MIFLHPEFLYYMLPPLFILFALLLTQKESHAEYFSEEVMSKLRVSANTMTLKARNILFLLMGFLIILALAQPVIKDGKVQIKAKSADIMIALDISDSMLAADIYPNRLEMAKQKALTLLDESPNERIGVVAFAKNSYLVSPLSFDTAAVSFLLRQLDTASITEKGTDFLSILDVVSKTQKEQKKKYLLILSDGGDKTDFTQEIKKAKKHAITVFVLGIATKKGAPIKLEDGTFIKHRGEIIVSKLNESIAQLATKTGGVYIQSTTSSDDIKTMLKEITNISDKKELRSEEIQKYIPLFYYPVALALFILLIATSSMRRKQSLSLPSVFILFALVFSNLHVEAAMLDFLQLKKAKEAYEKENFEESAKLYEQYGEDNANAESHYNAGNAYYKQKKYKEAIESYKKAALDTDEARAKNYSNMGNAYAKEGAAGSLEKAVESYEKSLEIQEDKDTRENLQEVKKLLEKQKENEDKKEDKDSDKKDSDEKNEQNKKEDKNSDEENSDEKKEQSKNEDKNSDEKQKEEENEKKPEQSKGKPDKLENNDKFEGKKEQSDSPKEPQKHNMSDAEEEKWLQELNSKSNTYIYKLNEKQPNRDNSDEKPW